MKLKCPFCNTTFNIKNYDFSGGEKFFSQFCDDCNETLLFDEDGDFIRCYDFDEDYDDDEHDEDYYDGPDNNVEEAWYNEDN